MTERNATMTRMNVLAVIVLASSVGIGAQQSAARKPAAPATPAAMSEAAKIKFATSVAPDDVSKGAAVMDMDEKGGMKQLRPGTNGWMCMIIPVGSEADAMCMDKAWSGWADAYMSKKTPPAPKTVGVAYMLRGDHGASNTDPFATGPTATN